MKPLVAWILNASMLLDVSLSQERAIKGLVIGRGGKSVDNAVVSAMLRANRAPARTDGSPLTSTSVGYNGEK